MLGYKSPPVYPKAGDAAKEAKRGYPPAEAWEFRFIQMQRRDFNLNGVYIDVDRRNGVRRIRYCVKNELLPEASYYTHNIDNGHIQVAWLLNDPVHSYNGASLKPVNWYNSIVEHFRKTLGGDACFGQSLMRNPMHPRNNTIFGSKEGGYELKELSRYVPRQATMSFFNRRPRLNMDRLLLEAALVREGERNNWLALGAIRGNPDYTRFGGMIRCTDEEIAENCHALNNAMIKPMPSSEVECIINSGIRSRLKLKKPAPNSQRAERDAEIVRLHIDVGMSLAETYRNVSERFDKVSYSNVREVVKRATGSATLAQARQARKDAEIANEVAECRNKSLVARRRKIGLMTVRRAVSRHQKRASTQTQGFNVEMNETSSSRREGAKTEA